MVADQAEVIALRALAFLAEDAQRLGRFLALTGVGPDELKAQAHAHHMLAAVLEHLLQDESLLLVFAAGSGIAPELIGAAHAALDRQRTQKP